MDKERKTKSNKIIKALGYVAMFAYVIFLATSGVNLLSSVISGAVVVGLALWFGLKHMPRESRWQGVYMCLVTVARVASLLLIPSARKASLVLIYLAFLSAIVACFELCRMDSTFVSFLFIQFVGLFLRMRAVYYTFVDMSDRKIMLWGLIPSGIITVTVLIISAYNAKRGAKLFNKDRPDFWNYFGVGFLTLVFTALVFCPITAFLNYALDKSEPTAIVAEVTDKEYFGGSRRRMSRYEFTLRTDNDEFELRVSRNVYKLYEKGDGFRVNIHTGAFDCPYYIADYEDN